MAGVWGDRDGGKPDHQGTRQYAIYFDLGACDSEAGKGKPPGPVYHHGLAAHISSRGGPTPGHEFCFAAACDPQPLPSEDWHCVSNVYDGTHINAYVNGSLAKNGRLNPFPCTAGSGCEHGIYSPEAANRTAEGAEFGVGVAMSFGYNQYTGLLGGLAVFSQALTQAQVAQVCSWPAEVRDP